MIVVLPDVGQPTFDVADYGAGPTSTAAANTAAWDAALAAAVAAGRGRVVCSVPGTYQFERTAGQSYCVLVPADDLELYAGPGVWLQIADAQQTDATGGCQLFSFTNRTNLWFNFRDATLSGNTAGQPGWTSASGEHGTRYSQTGASQLILGIGTVAGGGCHNIRIEVGRVTDCFSNGVWVASDTLDADNWTNSLIDLWVGKQDLCGECPQVQSAGWVFAEVVESIPSYGMTVGDNGVELSHCSHFYAKITSCIADPPYPDNGLGGGAVVDAFASKHGLVEIGYAEGVVQFCTAETNFGDPTKYADDVTIRGGTVKDCSGQTIIAAAGRTMIQGVTIGGALYSLQVTQTPVAGHFCEVADCVFGGDSVYVAAEGFVLNFSNTRLVGRGAGVTLAGISCLASGTLHVTDGEITDYSVGVQAVGAGVVVTGNLRTRFGPTTNWTDASTGPADLTGLSISVGSRVTETQAGVVTTTGTSAAWVLTNPTLLVTTWGWQPGNAAIGFYYGDAANPFQVRVFNVDAVTAVLTPLGGVGVPTLADSAAVNGTVFIGSDHANKLCRKAGGVVTEIG